MRFDNFGNLIPYELIEIDLLTFEETFVNAFPSSATRKGLFANFLEYRKKLDLILGERFFQWVNGSFTSSKLNPNDIDFVTFIDTPLFNVHMQAIEELRLVRYKRSYGMDGYFVEVYPDSNKKNFLYQADRIQWLHTFGKSRTNRPKGIIQLTGEHGRE